MCSFYFTAQFVILSLIQHRWSRGRSKERLRGSLGQDLEGRRDSQSDYAADNSSAEHSSSATPHQSPRHRARTLEDSPLAKGADRNATMSGTGAVGSVNEGASSSGVASVLKVLTAKVDVEATAGPSGLSHLTIGGLPKVSEIAGPSGMSGLSPAEEQQRRRETQLRQHSFFQLRVHLISGHGLVAMDKSGKIFEVVRMRRVNTFRRLLGVSGTSDPYVKFKVGGRLLYKSKTVHKDLNPVWDETFVVPVEDPFQPIVIKVMSNIHQFYQ